MTRTLGGIVLLLPAGGLAHVAFPGTNGKIAFTTNRDGNDEIYSMRADGSGQGAWQYLLRGVTSALVSSGRDAATTSNTYCGYS